MNNISIKNIKNFQQPHRQYINSISNTKIINNINIINTNGIVNIDKPYQQQ